MTSKPTGNYDVVIIGAGVSGMYAVHHFREMGLSVRAYDGASDVGGTWWYNCYPGARIDGPGAPFYCYTFTDEFMKEWDWAETQSEQSDVLAYLEYVADKLDLRRDIQFETWGTERQLRRSDAALDDRDEHRRASHRPVPDLRGRRAVDGEHARHPGHQRLRGRGATTPASWPHEPVSFEGKRVAVIGTGSSGHPGDSRRLPRTGGARDGAAAYGTVLRPRQQSSRSRPKRWQEAREDFETLSRQEDAREFGGGFPLRSQPRSASALDYTPEEASRALYEMLWQRGELQVLPRIGYNDIATSEEANASLADFIRDKIREIVDGPRQTAEEAAA